VKSDAEEIIIALGRIERAIEKMSETSDDKLEDINISLRDIAQSQETVARALRLIASIVDERL
jgi:hypothetical protein